MNYQIHPDLDKILSKLVKKDKIQYEAILKNITQKREQDNLFSLWPL